MSKKKKKRAGAKPPSVCPVCYRTVMGVEEVAKVKRNIVLTDPERAVLSLIPLGMSVIPKAVRSLPRRPKSFEIIFGELLATADENLQTQVTNLYVQKATGYTDVYIKAAIKGFEYHGFIKRDIFYEFDSTRIITFNRDLFK